MLFPNSFVGGIVLTQLLILHFELFVFWRAECQILSYEWAFAYCRLRLFWQLLRSFGLSSSANLLVFCSFDIRVWLTCVTVELVDSVAMALWTNDQLELYWRSLGSIFRMIFALLSIFISIALVVVLYCLSYKIRRTTKLTIRLPFSLTVSLHGNFTLALPKSNYWVDGLSKRYTYVSVLINCRCLLCFWCLYYFIFIFCLQIQIDSLALFFFVDVCFFLQFLFLFCIASSFVRYCFVWLLSRI